MEKIRLALLTYTIDGRRAKGTAVVARKSVEAVLSRDEFDVTLLHFEKDDDEVYAGSAREVLFPRFRWGFLNFRSLRMLYYFLTTKDRYDIVHWYQPRVYPFFFLAPTKHTVATLHGAGDVTENRLRFVWSRAMFIWTLRYLGRFMSGVIAGSEFAKRDIVRRYGFAPERVHVVNNGVESVFAPQSAQAIADVIKKYNLPEKFYMNVARLIPSKNVMRTFRAYELFREKNPDSDLKFVNIGTAGTERPAVDALMNASRYREDMQLVGYVDQADLPALYSSAFALVFPILNEGFGLPAVEAMACGTPAVISDTAAPEMTPTDTYLVNALDEQSIADAMHVLANDPVRYAQLKSGGLAKAATYTWEISGEKIIALYREIMHK